MQNQTRGKKMSNVLYIEGFIGEVYDFWTDELKNTSNRGIVKNLENVSGDIELHINSKGGDAFEGLAILGTLKNYDKGYKTAIVDGFCASSATLPLFAMDNVKAHPTAMFCFHKSGTMAYGHANDLRKSADDLDRIDGVITDLYMNKFTGTLEELDAILDEDRLMTAQEAFDLGFIDEIIQDEPEEPEDKSDEQIGLSFLDGFTLAKEHVQEEHDKLENSFLNKFKKIE